MASSELALTDVYPPSTFSGFKALQNAVKEKIEKLNDGGDDQYISLKHVSKKDNDSIDNRRGKLGAKVLLTYFSDIETLIVKVPTHEHERAHRVMARDVEWKIRGMGVSGREFMPNGSARCIGPTQSEKEGDSTWTNTQLRPQGGWPFLAIEAGVSESQPRLRQDAAWWLSNSNGQVRLVLLIKVARQSRQITIEKYDQFQARATRTIVINQSMTPATCNVRVPTGTATGPALTLEFDLIVGRPANPPLERNVEFTAADLINRYASIFR